MVQESVCLGDAPELASRMDAKAQNGKQVTAHAIVPDSEDSASESDILDADSNGCANGSPASANGDAHAVPEPAAPAAGINGAPHESAATGEPEPKPALSPKWNVNAKEFVPTFGGFEAAGAAAPGDAASAAAGADAVQGEGEAEDCCTSPANGAVPQLVAYYDEAGNYLYTAPYAPCDSDAQYASGYWGADGAWYPNDGSTWFGYDSNGTAGGYGGANAAYGQGAEGSDASDDGGAAFAEATLAALCDAFPAYSYEQLYAALEQSGWDALACCDTLFALEVEHAGAATAAAANGSGSGGKKKGRKGRGGSGGGGGSKADLDLTSTEHFPALASAPSDGVGAAPANGSDSAPAPGDAAAAAAAVESVEDGAAANGEAAEGAAEAGSVGEQPLPQQGGAPDAPAAAADSAANGAPNGAAPPAAAPPKATSFLAAARKAAEAEAAAAAAAEAGADKAPAAAAGAGDDKGRPPAPRTPTKQPAAVAAPRVKTGAAVSAQYATARGAARDQARLRNMYFMQATQAYLAGNKKLARELGAKGRAANDAMKAAHATAGSAIYRQRSAAAAKAGGNAAANFVDLHGLHVSEALDILSKELRAAQERAASAGSGKASARARRLQVCVGTGSHTVGAKAKLPAAVERHLADTGLQYSWAMPGLLSVQLLQQ